MKLKMNLELKKIEIGLADWNFADPKLILENFQIQVYCKP